MISTNLKIVKTPSYLGFGFNLGQSPTVETSIRNRGFGCLIRNGTLFSTYFYMVYLYLRSQERYSKVYMMRSMDF